MNKQSLAALALAAGLTASVVPAAPALADGAASTRNILIGGAAAAAGTLILINHNKQVHAKYAEDARQQAAAQAQANNAEAAYESEKSAYQNQSAVLSEYKHEVVVQHQQIVALRRQVSMETKRGDTFKREATQTAFSAPATAARPAAPQQRVAQKSAPNRVVATTDYGWGSL